MKDRRASLFRKSFKRTSSRKQNDQEEKPEESGLVVGEGRVNEDVWQCLKTNVATTYMSAL